MIVLKVVASSRQLRGISSRRARRMSPSSMARAGEAALASIGRIDSSRALVGSLIA